MVNRYCRKYRFQDELVFFQKVEGRHGREERETASLARTALMAGPREEGQSKSKTVQARQVSWHAAWTQWPL